MKKTMFIIVFVSTFFSFGLASGGVGQQGYAGLAWINGDKLIFSSWDYWGINLLDTNTKEVQAVGGDLARGRYLNYSEITGFIGYKNFVKVKDNYLQEARGLFWNHRDEAVFTKPVPRVGVPSISNEGLILVSEDEKVYLINDNHISKTIDINCYANCARIAPNGESFVFNNELDQIILYDLITENQVPLTPPGEGYFNPRWSVSGRMILMQSLGGEIIIFDMESKTLKRLASGSYPSFVGKQGILFTRSTEEHYRLLSSDLFYYDFISDSIFSVTASQDFFEGEGVVSPDLQKVAYRDLLTGSIWLADLRFDHHALRIESPRLLLSGETLEGPARSSIVPATPMVMVWAPYLHQKWDTPDWFNGSWSCGPTSCIMAVQKYDKLPAHPITCSWPYEHISNYGWYIPTEYTYNSYTYDILGLAPDDTWVPGAHGFICRDLGAAYWSYMCDFMNQHTLSAWWAGTAWSTLCEQVDAGYPMVVSTSTLGYGHIMLFKGYSPDHTIIANDPYGDANTAPWGEYNGETVYYDWPGYDNGHLELGISQLFGAQGIGGGIPEADTIVDDLCSGFSKFGPPEYWHEWTGGYESHIWWTYSTNASEDTNYVTWTPNLPRAGYWEVSVHVPSNYATTNARYKIFHNAGNNTQIVPQSIYSNEWVSVGTYIFNKQEGGYVYLGDGADEAGHYLGCDAVKWNWRPQPCDTLVDDLTTGFSYFGSMDYWWDWAGGYNHHIFYTYSTAASFDTNYARWTPDLPMDGNYEVFVYIPGNHAGANAPYIVYAMDGDRTVWVNQSAYSDQWVSLGTFSFNMVEVELKLGDGTGTPGYKIGFDAAKWSYRSPLNVLNDFNIIDKFNILCYPNPFNAVSRINIHCPENSNLQLKILNLNGQQVKTIYKGYLEAGKHHFEWVPKGCGSGIFYAQVETASMKKTIKLLYLK
ncbi:C39 family peptidase [bacterium]|nr:C39 family peptidase [bacterium]